MAIHHKVTLIRVVSNHDNLRDTLIHGICNDLPAIDKVFYLFGPGKEFGTRIVRTTPVVSVTRLDDTILFKTKNSTYALHISGEFDDEAKEKSLQAN